MSDMRQFAIPKFAIAILLASGIAFAGAVLISAYDGASVWYYALGLLIAPAALRHGQLALHDVLSAVHTPYERDDYIRRPYVRLLVVVIVIGLGIITSAAIWGSHTQLVFAGAGAVTAPIVLMLLEPRLVPTYYDTYYSWYSWRIQRRERKDGRRRTKRMRRRIGHASHAEATAGKNHQNHSDTP